MDFSALLTVICSPRTEMNGLGQSARALRRQHPCPVSGTPLCVCLGVKKGRALLSPHICFLTSAPQDVLWVLKAEV